MLQYIIEKGNFYPSGVSVLKDGSLNISIEMESEDCGIILYENNREFKIPFTSSCQIGSLYCVSVYGLNNTDELKYCFYDGDKIFVDSYAKSVSGNEQYGEYAQQLKGCLYDDIFDWQDDKPLLIPYSDSIIYQLHVRGFTKHSSSKVVNNGSFEGLIEKIPYLKELGITAVELLPCYEFLEIEKNDIPDDSVSPSCTRPEPTLNYWGYKSGFYFAPKSAYASGNNPVRSFKTMVKELHKHNIEIIMQFYFPDEVSKAYITEVLRHWVCEYHVDGFHLKGNRIPTDIIGADPILRNTKLIYYGFPTMDIYHNRELRYKNLAECRDDFMYDMRRFLKSDECVVGNVLFHMKANPKEQAIVHYITDTNGFTLCDLVSYDRKHNENNGENNLDGNLYNASWNCGVEGVTDNKLILKLRLKQMKNAVLLNLFSQSVPMLLAGDEFANSQNGNNNAYCQDNLIGWLNWDDIEKNRNLFDFVKDVISFRKEHAMLHKKKEYTMLDEKAYGYPDLSYHSEEPWKCAYDDLTRHFAMMFCGYYSDDVNEKACFLYFAANMHWIPHKFALPKLPDGKKWYLLYNTESSVIRSDTQIEDQNEIIVSDRTICVFTAI